MATPHEKLAESLEVLHVLQAEGRIAIRSQDLSRTHRERLLRSGFLEEVMKGWYVPARPRMRRRVKALLGMRLFGSFAPPILNR